MTARSRAPGSLQDPAQFKFPDSKHLSKEPGLRYVQDGPNHPAKHIVNCVRKGNPVAPRPSATPMVNSAYLKALPLPTTGDTPEVPKYGTGQGTTFQHRPDQQLVEEMGELIINQAFDATLHRLMDKLEAQASVSRCVEELSRIIGASGPGEFQQSLQETPSGEDKSTAGADTPGNGARCIFGSSSRSRKRTNSQGNSEDEDPCSNGGRQGNGEDESFMRSKKIKIEGKESQYPCPYRKRNPLRFNIRDYNTCATTSTVDIPNLKYVFTWRA